MLTPVYSLTVNPGAIAGVRTLSFSNGTLVDNGGGQVTFTAPSTSPGGSSGQLQYNSGGSFAGAAALTYATTGANLTVTASGAAVVPLVLKGATGQTANLFECQDVSGNKVLELVGGTTSLTLLRVGQYSGLSGVTYGADGADRWTMYTSGASSYAWQFGRYGANNCFAADQSDRIMLATGGILASPPGQVTVGTLSASRPALCVRGATSQTANLLELQNSAGTVGLAIAANTRDLVLDTTTGTKIGTATTQKLGFWDASPVVQQVLATGAAHTVDDVISLLQTLGLCRQS